MKQFKRINSISGWITFAIAAFTYLATIEPTASFWDCGEYIATGFKLEVGHPPGNAVFELMANFFTQFAGSDVTKISVMVNIMSALASAFTILLLFWSITHLARKILAKDGNFTTGNTIAIIGAGLVGALAYTFSDSFWFSAVEAEVYASSSLFTALVFWAILKWEDVADEKYANRWIILIAYLMGLSTGVHLLNLLAIPAIVFVYYFKKYPVTTKGTIYASIVSILLLGGVLYGMVQGLIYGAAYMDLLFVNVFGLPFYSGVFFFIIILIGIIIWGLNYTYKHRKVLLNTALLMFTVILLGYSSVSVIVIRSMANTPLDENDPENMFSLLYYLNREQYGDRPLLVGPVYNAPAIGYEEDGKPTYTPINGKYEITNRKVQYKFDERFMMTFPRMFSQEPDHVRAYQYWGNVKGIPIETTDNRGEAKTLYKPTFIENLKFFFSYQVNHMYFRYFMWNFAGRQNDIQGHGEVTKGNWISGVKIVDEMRLGTQSKLPDYMVNNKARNAYFLLPFLLGMVGLYYHYKKDKKDFSILMMLFFFTGLAIVLYLNQTPYQPRERDYAYVGSFYVFAFWIGLGVLGIYEFLSNKIPAVVKASVITLACLLLVPGIMAKENWDDHDRSGRYTARDFAYNYLNSCDKNAIIFTNGDNDTFPLWYAQEVEGIRTDVRVVNLSYLSADWYVGQMWAKAYESDPLPLSLTRNQVLQGKRDIIYLFDRVKDTPELRDAVGFVASDDPQTKTVPNYGERVDYIPSKKFKLTVDSAAVFANNYLSKEYAGKIVDKMEWSINRSYITKADLMILDILSQNNWKRPVYFAITVSHDNYLNLDEYLQTTGLAYKIVPVKTEAPQGEINNIDTKLVYENLMHKFRWGGINNPNVYLDENNTRMLSNFRNSFYKLAEALIAEGKNDSALTVLNKGMELMPEKCVPYNYFVLPFIDIYYRLGQKEKADAIAVSLGNAMEKELNYYFRLNEGDRGLIDNDVRIALQITRQLSMIAKQYGNKELDSKYEGIFAKYANLYQPGS
jgi:hypothetical protein